MRVLCLLVPAGPLLRGRSRPSSVEPSATAPPHLARHPRETEAQDLADRSAASIAAALFDLGALFSPWVELGPSCAYLEIDDLGRLFPTEPRLLAAVEQAARRLTLPVQLGLADDRYTAHIAAQLARVGAPERVGVGQAAAYLAHRPVALLPASATTQQTLARWGVYQIGELANLPEGGVALRLGGEGTLLSRIARGEASAPLLPRPPGLEFVESGELEWCLYEVEPFLFAVQQSLQRLQQRLALRALQARALEVTLRLDVSTAADGTASEVVRRIELAAPTRDLATWQVMLRLRLEGEPPPAPIVGFAIRAEPDRVRPHQLGLWEPVGPSPEKLATAIGRIAALVGRERIGVPLVVDSHHPEATRMAPAETLVAQRAPVRRDVQSNAPTCAPLRSLALHLFRPPRAATVRADRQQLRFVRADGISGTVCRQSGPFLIRDAWWDPARAIERAYYDVELGDGGVYRLFEDRQGWHVVGVYE